MPSSPLRSSASITNTFTSSMTPAMMAKLPMNRNRAPNSPPMASASSSSSCLGVATAVPWPPRGPRAAWSLALTWSLAAAPPSTPPVLETRVRVSGPARPPTGPATQDSVPGSTKAPCSPNPASPLAGTTLATSRVTGRPSRWKVTRSPARASTASARLSLSTTRPRPGAGPASDDPGPSKPAAAAKSSSSRVAWGSPLPPETAAAPWRRTVRRPSTAGSPRRGSRRRAASSPWAGSGEDTTSSTTPRSR